MVPYVKFSSEDRKKNLLMWDCTLVGFLLTKDLKNLCQASHDKMGLIPYIDKESLCFLKRWLFILYIVTYVLCFCYVGFSNRSRRTRRQSISRSQDQTVFQVSVIFFFLFFYQKSISNKIRYVFVTDYCLISRNVREYQFQIHVHVY